MTRRRGIHFSATLVLSTVLTLAVTVGLLTANLSAMFTSAVWEESERVILAQCQAVEAEIDSLLSDAFSAAAQISQDSGAPAYLIGGGSSSALDRVRGRRTLARELRSALVANKSISGILIFLDSGAMCGRTENWAFFPTEPASALSERLRGNGSQIRWGGTVRLEELIGRPLAENDVLNAPMLYGTYRVVYYYSRGEGLYGVTTVVLVDESDVAACYAHLTDADDRICLLDADGRVLSGGETGAVPPWYEPLEEGSGYRRMAWSGEDGSWQIISYRLSGTGWTLEWRIPADVHASQTVGLRRAALRISGLVLLLAAAVILLWGMAVSLPVRRITAAMERVREGDLAARVPTGREKGRGYAVREFGDIAQTANSMLDSLNAALRRTEEIGREKMDLEMQRLQNQLNPHMIFNSITAIRWSVMLQSENWPGAEETSEMLVRLAELLRPVFGEWRPMWSLREEMEYTGIYMELLRLRYGGLFRVRKDVPEELLPLQVPRFVLQPIFENSCEHGAEMQTPIDVSLTIAREGDFLSMTVTDNGRGMTPEMLQAVRERLRDEREETEVRFGRRSIGLYNVHRRVSLLGGEGCGLTLESEEGKGTSVTVRTRV